MYTNTEVIDESELILNKDGSIYHLNLHPKELADTIILVGDPGRVPKISKYFDRIDVQKKNREITTHTGELGGKRLSVLSTGMGCGNMDIVMNEIDALFNIDLDKRIRNSKQHKVNLIRLGTSGALRADIPVDSFVASRYAIGMDGILQYYQKEGSVFDKELANAFIQTTSWPEHLPHPYAVEGNQSLLKSLAHDMIHGITLTALGFYGPQNRILNARLAFPHLHESFQDFSFNRYDATNLEMETSSLYGFSRLFGFNALTICLMVANRVTSTFSKDAKHSMNKLIEKVLYRIVED